MSDKIQRDVQFARVLVVIATVALLLVLSMPWYLNGETNNGETFVSASGWGLFSMLTEDKGIYVFAGYFSWVVVLLALFAGVGVLQLRQRWVCVTLCVLLVVDAVGLFLVANQFDDDLRADQLAGTWAGLVVMVFAAVVWGNLAGPLRELSYEKE